MLQRSIGTNKAYLLLDTQLQASLLMRGTSQANRVALLVYFTSYPRMVCQARPSKQARLEVVSPPRKEREATSLQTGGELHARGPGGAGAARTYLYRAVHL